MIWRIRSAPASLRASVSTWAWICSGEHAERLRRGGAGDGGDLVADGVVAQHDAGEVAAAGGVEGDALQLPAAGGEGEADRGDEEEQAGQATTHRASLA